MPAYDPFEVDDGQQRDATLPERVDLQGFGSLPAGVSARQIRTQYVTAMAVPQPRDLLKVEAALLAAAAQLGRTAYYTWAVKDEDGPGQEKKPIEGPSIDLALAAARCYGNCAVEPLPVDETPQAWYFRYAFIDLETGFTLIRPFRQSKTWVVYGRFDEQRKEDIRFQLGASKAIRNVIVNALGDFVMRAMIRAKKGERDKIERFIKGQGLPAAQQALMTILANVGVTEAQVLARVGRPTVAALTIEDMVQLRGDATALENGNELLETLFPPVVVPNAPGPESATADALKTRLRAARTPRQPREGLATDEQLAELRATVADLQDASLQASVDESLSHWPQGVPLSAFKAILESVEARIPQPPPDPEPSLEGAPAEDPDGLLS